MNPDFWRGKRVLVTGGLGFLGRWLCRTLSESEIAVIDARDVPVPRWSLDLSQAGQAGRAISETRSEMVLHLAGAPGVRWCEEFCGQAFNDNVAATGKLLEACRLSEVPMIHVSSNHVYGPQYDDGLKTTEDAPLNGRGIYAATKIAADILAQSYGKTYGLPVGVARITNTYGPDDHHAEHLITSMIRAGLRGERPVIRGTGLDRKGFCYIEDTIAGILAIAEGVVGDKSLAGEAFNIVPDDAPTVLEVARKTLDACGREFIEPLIEKPTGHFDTEHLSNAKAGRILGWHPRHDLASGLKKTVEWYRANG